jgi:hypothetical protein
LQRIRQASRLQHAMHFGHSLIDDLSAAEFRGERARPKPPAMIVDIRARVGQTPWLSVSACCPAAFKDGSKAAAGATPALTSQNLRRFIFPIAAPV